ncbi:MAG: NUDIX domain-containing protein [Negativicoccus succinicivorans]|nr:NUDIX domain-containing protein [Negativicoccus succinicivorans]
MERRPEEGMLAGMWQFPQQLARTLTAAKEELFAQYPPQSKQWFWRHKHVFSHRIWELRAYRATPPSTLAGDFRWVRPDEFVTLPMAGPHAKLATYILDRDR